MTPDATKHFFQSSSGPIGASIIAPAPHDSVAPSQFPTIPDHELLKKIGGGSYGEVWLAKSKLGTYRAVKLVYRKTFDDIRPDGAHFSDRGALWLSEWLGPMLLAPEPPRTRAHIR